MQKNSNYTSIQNEFDDEHIYYYYLNNQEGWIMYVRLNCKRQTKKINHAKVANRNRKEK